MNKYFQPILLISLLLFASAGSTTPCQAQTWEDLDKKLKSKVYQLNVGLKLRLKNGKWVQLSDLSPRYHFPVFTSSTTDRGYRVVGFGTSFPVKTIKQDRSYFLTNRHVVDSSVQIIKECGRFYAAMRLYAEQTSSQPERRLKQLEQIINLAAKETRTTAELTTYQQTADAIWETYETYMSVKADPSRLLYRKYKKLMPISAETGFFLHPPGPVSRPAIEARLYKVARLDSQPDLAILAVDNKDVSGMEFDHVPPTEGQEIQVIGYPTASDQIDRDSGQYYAPTFNTGRISRVAPRILQVDAPVTTGNSGGPVVSLKGKVVGVVAVRAISARGGELPNFGGAITVPSVKAFAPELFSSQVAAPKKRRDDNDF